MKTVRSYDVFDTCLTRRTAVPSGIFYAAARKVFSRLGLAPERAIVEDFVAARIQAERAARRQTSSEDVTLEEIWRILTRSMGWQWDATLAACELEAEDESLVPIAAMRREVQAARQAGDRIVFVSDMYLPADFVAKQLKKHGFAEAGDGVYVSAAIGKTKGSGNLFRHVLQQENVAPETFLHTGDNSHGDFAIPRSLGIEARLCEPARMTRTELGMLQAEGDSHGAAIAGTMRAFRLAGNSAEMDPMHELAAQFIGPFVMGFATWVLQRAQEQGVKRLYFLSRDCQLASKVARELAPQFGGIDCRYLYVSRQALFLPSAEAISPDGMPWMRRDFEEPVLKKLLAKIELTYENVEAVLGDLAGHKRGDYHLKSDEDWARFWKALDTEPVKTRINNLIATRRNLTRKYFEAEGLFQDVPWAMVDLGWALTCQQSIWKMLKKWGRPETMRGYYFGLVKPRIGPEGAGLSEAIFYQLASDFPDSTKVGNVFARITLLEHIVGCADHPTVHHHEELVSGGMGAAYAGSVNETTLKFCHRLHERTLAFVRESKSLVEDFKDPEVCQRVLASLVPVFFSSPTESSASALLGMSATGDQNGLDPLPIVEPLDWGKALLPIWPKAKTSTGKWQTSDSFWLEGSIALTPPRVRKLSIMVQRAANRWAKIRGTASRR